MRDSQLVEAAGDVAAKVAKGGTVPASVTSLLRAIASTKTEAERHELARQAEARAGQLTDVAIQVLRVAIFALSMLFAVRI